MPLVTTALAVLSSLVFSTARLSSPDIVGVYAFIASGLLKDILAAPSLLSKIAV